MLFRSIESNPNAREDSVQIRKTNDPDCNVVKLMMLLLIESNPNARENSVQIRKTNDPD